jgi:hypothetical protein
MQYNVAAKENLMTELRRRLEIFEGFAVERMMPTDFACGRTDYPAISMRVGIYHWNSGLWPINPKIISTELKIDVDVKFSGECPGQV